MIKIKSISMLTVILASAAFLNEYRVQFEKSNGEFIYWFGPSVPHNKIIGKGSETEYTALCPIDKTKPHFVDDRTYLIFSGKNSAPITYSTLVYSKMLGDINQDSAIEFMKADIRRLGFVGGLVQCDHPINRMFYNKNLGNNLCCFNTSR